MKLKDVLKFFKKYFRYEKSLFIKSFIFIFFSSIIGVSFGYLIGEAVEYATNQVFGLAVLILVVYLLLALIDNIFFDRLGKIFIKKACSNTMERISYDVYYKVGLLPARAFEDKTSGEFINRVVIDSATITDTFRQFINVFTTLFTAVLIFIYILLNSYIVALEILIYFVVFYLFSKTFLPIIKKAQREITEEKDKTIAEVNESIRGIREIRALGIRTKVNEIVKRIINIMFIKTKKQMVDEENYYSVAYALGALLEVVVFITCIILMFQGKSDVGFFMAMTYYIYRFTFLVEWLMNFSTSYQKMRVSVERVQEIVGNKLYKDIEFGSLDKTDIKGNIEFKNVTFGYSEEEGNILENFNLTIPSNKSIAIVGKSGQGKSTIFNLLLRYFEPKEGVILIDDNPLDSFTEEAMHQNIAIIRQDPFIFNKSILDNFKIMDSKVTVDQIRKYCKLAETDD